LKEVILSKARQLANLPKDAEYAIVIFEDGYVTPIITQGYFASTMVPFKTPDHGYARAVIHTHPLPRLSPSVADLRLLFILSMYGAPAYLATVYRDERKVIVTLYIARRKIAPSEAEVALRKAYTYELAHAYLGFKEGLSEKQLREQHRSLQRIGVSVERYSFNLNEGA